MKLSVLALALTIAAIAFPATASAQPANAIGNAVSAHGTSSSNGCWKAWAFAEAINASGHEVGESWLHANACGPMRNVSGKVTCKPFRKWTCVGKPTFKAYRVIGHPHERKLVGEANIARQISPSEATGTSLTSCIVVKRGIGFLHKCRRIPR